MRDIKFQFIYKDIPFSGDNSEFRYHRKVYTLDQMLEKPVKDMSDIHDNCELIAKRQFTGLIDKNGVEIYENDLIELCGDKKGALRVEFVNAYVGGWILTYRDKSLEESYTLSLGARQPHEIEVIGNIYENAELLK